MRMCVCVSATSWQNSIISYDGYMYLSRFKVQGVCVCVCVCVCVQAIYTHLEVLYDISISEQVLQDHDGIHVVPSVGAVHGKLFRLEGGQHSRRISHSSTCNIIRVYCLLL